MRQSLIILISTLSTATLYGQKNTVVKYNNHDTTNFVSFIVKFDKKCATKDGYYLGGYVVNIDKSQSTRLNGQTIKITGKVSIEKGLGSEASKQNENGNSPVVQGRLRDTKHIESPTIEIIKPKN